MTIDSSTLKTAKELKAALDAAYLVFKKQPVIDNASRWTAAQHAYNDFCVNLVTKLIEPDDIEDMTEEILTNIDEYKTCKQCNAELLFPTSNTGYLASSDFIAEFPGWCYPCLTEYCATHECGACDITNPLTCTFKEVKKLQQD